MDIFTAIPLVPAKNVSHTYICCIYTYVYIHIYIYGSISLFIYLSNLLEIDNIAASEEKKWVLEAGGGESFARIPSTNLEFSNVTIFPIPQINGT